MLDTIAVTHVGNFCLPFSRRTCFLGDDVSYRKIGGGLGRRERHGGVGFSRALGDEGGQGGHLVGARQAVVQIVGDVDAELGRRLRDRAEDVPGREARL